MPCEVHLISMPMPVETLLCWNQRVFKDRRSAAASFSLASHLIPCYNWVAVKELRLSYHNGYT